MQMNETFPVVRIHDPALAAASLAEIKKYAESRDPADLPDVPAGFPQPVVFHCRRLTRSQMLDHVEVIDGEERKWARAFTAGVVRITGGRFGDGWEPEGPKSKQRLPITDEELDQAQLAPADLKEIGQVIYARSDVPFDCAPRYRLLPSSLDAWGGNARRYAAQSQAAARQSSGPPKGE